VLHWLWDFSTFMASSGEGTASTAATASLQGVVAYGAIVVLIVALIKRSLFRTGASASATAPATATVA
jgi:hypothetical protein